MGVERGRRGKVAQEIGRIYAPGSLRGCQGAGCGDDGGMEPVRWSVVIPAYNEAGMIAGTVEAVRGAFAEAWPEAELEVVVCDNHSTDGTGAVAEGVGARVVFEPHNQIARARNAGARAARGEWLLFLDADTMVGTALLGEMRRGVESGAAGGGGARVKFDAARLRPLPALVLGGWNALSCVTGLAAGSFIFCRRADWEAVGGFDERLYAAEELDFSRKLQRRLRARGERMVVCREAVVTSARKLEWHNDWQLLGLVPLAFQPWRWRRREACGFWYVRGQAK